MANFQPMSIRHPLAVFLLMIMAMSLVWSKALLSIVMVLIAVLAAISLQVNPFRIKWVLTPKLIRESIRITPFLWVFALFALMYLVSILYAGDVAAWWKLTHPTLAFLLVPMSFALLGPFSKKEYMLITLCLVVTALWSTIWVQVAYYSNYYVFSQSMGFGGSLPTPINHIRYSVVIALSMIICLAFCIENWKLRYRWERWAYGLAAAYLFYFLHVLSVRSGMMLAYAGIFILMIFYLQKLSRWMQAALLIGMIAAPVIAYKTMPGFQLKVHYTLYDLGQFKAGTGANYSDSERWSSWQAGIALGNQHPFFGIGTGKFVSEMKAYYQNELKFDKWNRPHNQWINVFAIFGLTGLIIFCFILVYPMTFRDFWFPALFPTLYIVQLLSMIVEHPLDTEFGAMLFLVLTGLGLSTVGGEREGERKRR